MLNAVRLSVIKLNHLKFKNHSFSILRTTRVSITTPVSSTIMLCVKFSYSCADSRFAECR